MKRKKEKNNKKLLLGMILIFLGIAIASVYFITLPQLDNPAGKFQFKGTGIVEFMKTKRDAIYIDNSFDDQTKAKIN